MNDGPGPSDQPQPGYAELLAVILQFRDAVELQFERMHREFARKSDLEAFATKADLDALRHDMTRRFDRNDERFDGIDGRLDGIDGRLDGIDGRLDGIDGELHVVRDAVGTIDARLTSLERAAG